MQVAQHQSMPIRHEPTIIQWQTESISPRPTTMSNRIYQPLTFSIDDHLSEQHLTRLDLCSKNLKKIEKLPNNINFNVILLDYNDITKVEHLDVLNHLIELSISHNRLIDIRLIGRLKTLQKLSLSNNSIDSIECLKTLQNLIILNISGNNIQNINALNNCHLLQSLDASDNSIRQVEDFSHLTSLKYLNLHKNLIDTLISVSKFWPKSIHTLIISDNEIKDLTEISSLSSLINLNTLYIHDNPCLFVINDQHGCCQPFDHRPYILNWCLTIQNLDGIFITRKENLKAEWLLSQGKGRSFRIGEHNELIQYLIKVCGTDADERDDLHLSRIMLQQDLYRQNDNNENFMRTSDTMKDANDTLSKDTQGKLQQSLLISESEFVKYSPSSSVSTINEPIISNNRKTSESQQMRTPSPGHIQTINHNDEYNSNNRYINYDNRPIKPLDQNMLQSKLDQYPVDNHVNDDTTISRSRSNTINSQQIKRTSTHLAYNANRYSPKTTTHGPTMHINMRTKSNKNLPTQQQNQTKKRHTIAADNANTFHLQNRKTSVNKIKDKKLIDNDDDNDDDELQLKSAPINAMLSTRSTKINQDNTNELKKLTTSIETMRRSVLQAYLDLHERYTRTTELQTSALAALWKKFETQNLNHQHETNKILEENRLLKQRLNNLESQLNIKSSHHILHPPLRVHISKRDTKSFFLHWIPNPLNTQYKILGYRIYIDDILKDSVDSGIFNTIIDYIRDEGEYKIKVRTYNENDESEDSNIIIARFRRQYPTTTSQLESNISTPILDNINDNQLKQIQSSSIMINKQTEINQSMSSGGFPLSKQHIHTPTTPDKEIKTSDELISPITSNSSRTNSNDNIINFKPPRSPNSSPSHSDKSITKTESCSKVLFSNEPSSNTTTKRSPTRTGIMSRLAKSPHRIKRNNVLLNALPINLIPNQKEPEIKPIDQTTTSESVNNHGHFLDEQLLTASMDTINSTTIPSSSSSPPPPIPPRALRNKNSLDQNSS